LASKTLPSPPVVTMVVQSVEASWKDDTPHSFVLGVTRTDDVPHPSVPWNLVDKQTSNSPSLSEKLLQKDLHAFGLGSLPEAKDEKQLHASLLSEAALPANKWQAAEIEQKSDVDEFHSSTEVVLLQGKDQAREWAWQTSVESTSNHMWMTLNSLWNATQPSCFSCFFVQVGHEHDEQVMSVPSVGLGIGQWHREMETAISELAQEAAVLELAQQAEKGDAKAISALCACLDDSHREVQKAATAALVRLAEKGDEQAITAICARLADAKPHVRRPAVSALSSMAMRGNEATITALCGRLEDPNSYVREAAASVLAQVAVQAGKSRKQPQQPQRWHRHKSHRNAGWDAVSSYQQSHRREKI